MLVEALLLGIARTAVSMVRLVTDWWARRRRGPSERLQRVLATKKEFSDGLPDVLSHTNGDAIIRELRRKDTYPALDDSLRGISPWFKVELKGTYHRGVEVFVAIERVLIEGNVARPALNPDEPAARNVFVVGRIPYAAIEGIDWDGDEFYGFTHLYCRFRPFGRGPYESLELYDVPARDRGGGRKYYEHLEGVRWKPKRRTIAGGWRDRRALRKLDRNTHS